MLAFLVFLAHLLRQHLLQTIKSKANDGDIEKLSYKVNTNVTKLVGKSKPDLLRIQSPHYESVTHKKIDFSNTLCLKRKMLCHGSLYPWQDVK